MRFGITGMSSGGISTGAGASYLAGGHSDQCFVSKLNDCGGSVGRTSCALGKSRCNCSFLNTVGNLSLVVWTQKAISSAVRTKELSGTARSLTGAAFSCFICFLCNKNVRGNHRLHRIVHLSVLCANGYAIMVIYTRFKADIRRFRWVKCYEPCLVNM